MGYYRNAKWSNKYKGDGIELSEDDSKATCETYTGIDDSGSVRADFAIYRGQIESWELECESAHQMNSFYGIVTSKVTDFDACPCEGMSGGYGVDDDENYIYQGEDDIISGWDKPQFPAKKMFILKFKADWRENQCKLTIYYNGKKLNETNDDYTILLPEFDQDIVLYPCVTPYYVNSYCIIRYVCD